MNPKGKKIGSARRKIALMLVMLLSIVVYYFVLTGSHTGASRCSQMPTGTSNDASKHVSRWQKFDWLPERDKSTLLNNFVEHGVTPAWEANERHQSCSQAADDLVATATTIIQRHITKDYLHPVDDPSKAATYLEQAISTSPDCYTARLNLAILLPVITKNPPEDFKRMETSLLSGIPSSHPLYGKSLLWKGIALELQGKEKEAHAMYFQAFDAKPEFALQYFGKRAEVYKEAKRQVALFKDGRMGKEEGVRLQTTALKKLLFYNEFAKHFSGFNHVTKEQALGFHDVWYMLVKDVIPPYSIRVLQDCYRAMIKNGVLKFDDKQAKRYFHYNSPPARFMAAVLRGFVSNVWDTEMKATYTYMGGYPGGSELKPHVDRAQCEITMSVSVDVNPGEETCPLGLRLEPKKLLKERSVGTNTRPSDASKVAYVYPRIGDALMFRGRGLVHWRDPIPENMNCTNIFLHFVKSDFVGKID
eukprot:TRINITY_DN305_c0_g1_i2.p1 TRINITY_DN305_c0_g1~~TRINITY_DN305_c0_g1_i2.p1  ORF type:complete len:474 (+),score=113.02 TRINITY_DN305_c0_g1_i2:103-1524(+)